MSARILTAALFHETNTFVPELTPIEDFAIRCGPDILATAGDGSPLGAFVESGLRKGWKIIPSVDCRAIPSGMVGQWESQGIDPRRLSCIEVKAAAAHRRAYQSDSAGQHCRRHRRGMHQ